jgi:hypothetical protein
MYKSFVAELNIKSKGCFQNKRKIGKWRKVLENSTMKFRNAVTKAIEFRKNESTSMTQKIRDLRNDILNIPSHVFGEHKRCAEIGYFCNGTLKDGEQNIVPQLTELGLFEKLEVAITHLSIFCESLLYNVNSNSVESYNSIISKFIGGKRINFGLRGSYQSRCSGSVLQFNTQRVMTSLCNSMNKITPTTAVKVENNRKRNNDKKEKRYKLQS